MQNLYIGLNETTAENDEVIKNFVLGILEEKEAAYYEERKQGFINHKNFHILTMTTTTSHQSSRLTISHSVTHITSRAYGAAKHLIVAWLLSHFPR